ncbi:hypothetical protein AAW12_23770 [Sphingobacterium sp. Ag1]|uniref:hypothetical protein n=1 Tax=Sphingobacterium sp. Ag1 TaxID=1643451 RepID=UPI000627BB7A|nr:hypothetical protein [Sphingobacterium sp. Ag1]KKO89152.1 hypothetical protein AAW12_23770 [Sphingobacterium sp. Ag1]
MKLYFKSITSEPFSEFISYSSSSPIPVTLKLSRSTILPNTLYARNLYGENFIEFRFNRETRKLYEITIVAIQPDTVKFDNDNWIGRDEFYECCIEDENELEISEPIQILRSNKSLCFFWGEKPFHTYPIAKNCILGIDRDKKLCSVLLVNLNNELVYDILGF